MGPFWVWEITVSAFVWDSAHILFLRLWAGWSAMFWVTLCVCVSCTCMKWVLVWVCVCEREKCVLLIWSIHLQSAHHGKKMLPWKSQLIHASGNSKKVWQMPDATCTDLSSWWWAEKLLETCRALTIIKSIVQRCILLVMLKNVLKVFSISNAMYRTCWVLYNKGIWKNIMF